MQGHTADMAEEEEGKRGLCEEGLDEAVDAFRIGDPCSNFRGLLAKGEAEEGALGRGTVLSHSFQPGPEGLKKARKVLGFRDVPALASTRQHLAFGVQHPQVWGAQHTWQVWRHGNHEATEMTWTPLLSQIIPTHQCPK